MSKIEEMTIEKKESSEEMRIENRVQLTKVYVGSGDNFIMISGNDISIIDRFLKAGNQLEALADEMDKKESESDEKDYQKKIDERKYFSDKATEIMDGILGEGSTRKFFGDIYALIPNFQPDLECFLDFWDSLIPIIEKLSEHKVKMEKLASRQRMSKYKPQDYKRPKK